MVNSAYKLIKELKKSAAAMSGGSFLPPEPLPNSVKAKQIEEQEMLAEQADAGGNQLGQMQKAQLDAVNQLQQTQQQLMQTQGELQTIQSQAQQQQQAIQMQADQEIQKARMDAQYELQSEKIKNQQKLLAMQEKYMRAAGKPTKPDQNNILANQLKRVTKRVSNLKIATVAPGMLTPEQQARSNAALDKAMNTSTFDAGMSNVKAEAKNYAADPKKFWDTRGADLYDSGINTAMRSVMPSSWANKASPYVGGFMHGVTDVMGGRTMAAVLPSAVGNMSRGNFTEGFKDIGRGAVDMGGVVLGGALAKPLTGLGSKALGAVGGQLGRFGSAAGKGVGGFAGGSVGYEMADRLAVQPFQQYISNPILGSGRSTEVDFNSPAEETQGGSMPAFASNYPGGFTAPQLPQADMSPGERFSEQNRSMLSPYGMWKGAGVNPMHPISSPEGGSDLSSVINPKNPSKNQALYSPIPMLQTGLKANEFAYPMHNPSRQQGYGPLGDFIRQLVFQVGMPIMGMPAFANPNFSQVHGSLVNNQAYKLRV